LEMTKLTTANIQSFSMIGAVVASVVASTARVETANDYAARVKQDFDGKLEVVPHSVRDVSNNKRGLPAVAFHVRPVVESRPIEAAEQMRSVVEANVFADDEDATWKVVEAAGIKRLVKQSETDVAALLAAASNRNITRVAASFFDAGVGVVQEGEFAIFTNPETATVDSGIITYDENGNMKAIARGSADYVELSHDAIIAHSPFDAELEEGEQVEQASFAKRDAKPLLDYWKKLFSSQPAFFAQLEQMVRKRFLLA
jgi:hypothetical protein